MIQCLLTIPLKRVKRCSSPEQVVSELRGVTCHDMDHTVLLWAMTIKHGFHFVILTLLVLRHIDSLCLLNVIYFFLVNIFIIYSVA